MEAKSEITFPSGEMNLPEPGFYEITGLAWSGRGKIARVEISTDGGTSWSLAAAEPEVRIHSPPTGSPLRTCWTSAERQPGQNCNGLVKFRLRQRVFRSLFAADILKSFMGKDRSRDVSPKRLQRLAPPAAA
jgi:hypothetical protein